MCTVFHYLVKLYFYLFSPIAIISAVFNRITIRIAKYGHNMSCPYPSIPCPSPLKCSSLQVLRSRLLSVSTLFSISLSFRLKFIPNYLKSFGKVRLKIRIAPLGVWGEKHDNKLFWLLKSWVNSENPIIKKCHQVTKTLRFTKYCNSMFYF